MKKLQKNTWIAIGAVIVVFVLICLMTNKSEASIFDVPKEFEVLNGSDFSEFRLGIVPVNRVSLGITAQGVFDNTLLGMYGKYPFKEISTDSETLGLKELPVIGVPFICLSGLYDISSDRQDDKRFYWTYEVGMTVQAIEPDGSKSPFQWVYAYKTFRGQQNLVPEGNLHVIGVIIPLK